VLYHQDEDVLYKNSITREKFDKYFLSHDFLPFKEEDDRYVSVSGSGIFVPGEDFLLAMKITAAIDDILPYENLKYELIDSTLGGRYALLLIDGASFEGIVEFSGSRFIDNFPSSSNGLCLIGGLLLRSNNTYLLGYGPEKLQYDGSELKDSDQILVNKKTY